AISGVMGAYFFIYPLNKMKVWLAYFYVVEMPCFMVVGLWFLLQYFSTIFAVTSGEVHTGIAYWSHLGGFLTGILFILITLAILKLQQRAAEQEMAEEEMAPLEECEADRLFARAEQAKTETGPDPYRTFLPERQPPAATYLQKDK